jgi:hypothetical protein
MILPDEEKTITTSVFAWIIAVFSPHESKHVIYVVLRLFSNR